MAIKKVTAKEAAAITKAAVEAKADADPAIKQIIEKEEMSDDSELVAVITAAIHEYESSVSVGPTDSFVVRSIKRRR